MDTKVYAGRIKDRDVLKFCSSGGAFTVLSDIFINVGNAVLCSGYNYDTDQAEFRIVQSKAERDVCMGSMYMQSYALDSWREASKWLIMHPEKQLIFFGLGCQGAAFIKYCENNGLRDRVTVVDIVCHGSPSPMIWKQYAQTIERNGRLSDINFRDKRTGWKKSIGVAKINGNEISLSTWRKFYSSRVALRPCCSQCPYTVVERKTDITIGDFWNIEKSMPDFYDDMGTSIFLIHTKKGMELFDLAKNSLVYRESTVEDCWQPNLEKPTHHSIERNQFWREYRKKGISFVMKKYGNTSLVDRVTRKAYRELSKIFGAGCPKSNSGLS